MPCCARPDEDPRHAAAASQFPPEWAPATRKVEDTEEVEAAPWADDGRFVDDLAGWEKAEAHRAAGPPIRRGAAVAAATGAAACAAVATASGVGIATVGDGDHAAGASGASRAVSASAKAAAIDTRAAVD